MKIIAFFNNKGGVGKTSLVYHLAWMYADLGLTVLAADLDPQANLSAMFLEEDRLQELWPDGLHPDTLLGVIQPIFKGTGDIQSPHLETVEADGRCLDLLVGDLGLSSFEDKLSDAWPRCLDADEAAFRTISAFYRALLAAAQSQEADLILVDVGPNLGAINRAAILAAHHVVIPLAPDLFSLQGLRNLGPTFRNWRSGWEERLEKNPAPELPLPAPEMQPAGYVVMQHAVRLDRPVQSYARWMEQIPTEYREAVLGQAAEEAIRGVNDPHCLASLKRCPSLMLMAQEARKPIFLLRPADGAIGSHAAAVQDCYQDFRTLALRIADRCGIPVALPGRG
ncbi:ParA family protein [Methylacidimicrobium tartarophylax]|uniref:Sporulation initiation inhibitor protein Soj n=1 Tax=Methylacidimicrobium tartarophylax TaxID=1041768 RepID=A0A5E6MGR8_9BACT|nr:ParA family protein [Methylacidimicrobium tartarophylax]VVM04674.1 Sporulation initiation inhibitor protein Soj [Methylacidimicrobium tartarophylax]